MPVVSARDVADNLVLIAGRDEDTVSNLKLQKLLYYAQGFHLALYDEPLFDEVIEAWKHGPVVPDLYHEFKQFGDQPLELSGAPEDLPGDIEQLLGEVWGVYGQFAAWRLADITHTEEPWKEAWAERERSGRAEISHESLARYFKTRLV